MDDFSLILSSSVPCAVCNALDDVETLSSKLKEKIRDYQHVRSECETLTKKVEQRVQVITVQFKYSVSYYSYSTVTQPFCG